MKKSLLTILTLAKCRKRFVRTPRLGLAVANFLLTAAAAFQAC